MIKLQVSTPENSLKETPAQVFSCEFCKIFQKALFTEHLRMTATADSSVPTKVSSIDHTLFVFSFIFFPFIIDNCHYGSLFRKGIKMNIFLLFTIFYPKINMLVRQFRLGNNFPTYIRENTDFPRQKPRQFRVPRRISKAAT